MSSQEAKNEQEIIRLRGDTAIIGMACIFPKAPDLQTFWQNIVSEVDAITDVSPDRWDPESFYDENPDSESKLYCKRGGFIDDLAKFNPLDYGVMPLAVEGGEPDQFLTLRLAYEALADAGYLDKPLGNKRTKVIIGRGNYLGRGNSNVSQHTSGVRQVLGVLRDLHPEYSEDELEEIERSLLLSLPRSSPENAPSMIPNMLTGRIVNRLGFMGANYTVDAACASTLVATEIGVRDLLSGNCDIALVGGVHLCMEVPFLKVFCIMGAMSPSSEIRPFDRKADGLIAGEGLGVMILKRLEDAEKDGDRIYAVIKGVGTSSDGRGSSVIAPRVDGEELALLQAYEMSGVEPDSVELMEGHGTATSVGDNSELETLARVFGERDENLPSKCALGSVKSMIGHTMPAAGAAAMIKTALALYHKVLPPTLHCDEPNPRVNWSKSKLYINTETRPWIHGQDTPRRAGVNAFGFGGVNAHVILEEYRGSSEEETMTLWHKWDSEVIILQSESRQALIKEARQLQQYLTSSKSQQQGESPPYTLKDLAYTLNSQLGSTPYRLAIVATSVEDLQEKLEYSLGRLSDPDCRKIKYIKGVFFFEEPLARKGKLAFLFPGEGSQYMNMFADLCMHFPEVRRIFDQFDRASISQGNTYLPSQIIFPPPAFTEEEHKRAEERIWQMDGAIQAVLASNGALNHLLKSLDIRPDMVAGHSTGELSAMFASDMVTLDDQHVQSLIELDRLYKIADASSDIPEAVMVAVGADYDTVSAVASEIDGDVYVAMDNCPHQVVVVSQEKAGEQFMEKLRKRGIIHEKLAFDRAYHTPLFEGVCDTLLDHFREWDIKASDIPVYSCATMSPFPDDPEAILKLAVEHWMRPVEFRRTIEAMYEAGARIFVEVGPQSHLVGFVDDILRDREYLAMPANIQRRTGITQLNYLIGILAAHGVSMRLDYLYRRRSPKLLSLEAEEDRKLLQRDAIGTMILDLGFPELSVAGGGRPPLSPSTRLVPRVEEHLKGKADSSGEQNIQAQGTLHIQKKEGSDTESGQLETGISRPNMGSSTTPESITHDASAITRFDRVAQSSSVKRGELIPAEQNLSYTDMLNDAMEDSSPVPVSPQALENLEQNDSYSPLGSAEYGDSDSPSAKTRDEFLVQNSIMSQYLQTMGNFLRVQEEVIQAYLHNGREIDIQGDMEAAEYGDFPLPLSPSPHSSHILDLEVPLSGKEDGYPFVGTVVSFVPGREVVVLRVVDLDEDIFLCDHTFGGKISVDETLMALPVIPMTVGVEIMAEIAALLQPGKLLVGVKQVQANQWIRIEGKPITLHLSAQVQADNEVRVQVRDLGENAEADLEDIVSLPAPVMQGVMIFGDTYPEPPPVEELVLRDESPCKKTARQMYEEYLMFHGPRFQGVVSLDRSGSDGIEATLETLETDNLFRSNRNPRLITDAALLDAAGQVLGYWPLERLESGYNIFPIRLNTLHICGPNLPPGERLKCQVRIREVSPMRIRMDADLIRADGRIWMRIVGWEDWRFYTSAESYSFWKFPDRTILSRPYSDLISLLHKDNLGKQKSFECFFIGKFSGEASQEIWMNAWTYQILSHQERRLYKNLTGSKDKKHEWLFGRMAVKDAVRVFIRRRYGIALYPADIEIANDEYGRPVARGYWSKDVEFVPKISLSHSNGLAAAIAGESQFLGIDIEKISDREQGFEKLAFTEEEQSLLAQFPSPTQREEMQTRFWCAKEAVAKALGCGFVKSPLDLAVSDYEGKSRRQPSSGGKRGASAPRSQELEALAGIARVVLRGKLLDVFPEYASEKIVVYTTRYEDYIIAATIHELHRD